MATNTAAGSSELATIAPPVFTKPIPVLPVTSITRAVDFYVTCLAFTLGSSQEHFASVFVGDKAAVNIYLRLEAHPGAIVPCEVMIMVGGEVPPSLGRAEIDRLCDETRARGVDVGAGCQDQEWGFRQFGVRDPDGHRLVFFQHLPEM